MTEDGERGARREPGPSTRAVHGGERWPKADDALVEPVALTATYTFADTAALVDFKEGRTSREEYGRYGNPTVAALERKVSALEGAEDTAAFGSGMAAIGTTLLALLKSGGHVVLLADGYRRTRQLVAGTLGRYGVEHTLVEDPRAIADAIGPSTRVVVVECPSNPYLRVVDLPAIAARARAARARLVVDVTFATPVNLRALGHGADLVVHSATKYLAGHNDVLAGTVSGSAPLVGLVRELRGVLGGVLDPHAAFLVLRGLKTLALRVERQNATALALALALERHPRVRRVWYPALESHPDHDEARKLLSGAGGVVTFEIDGDVAATSAFVDRLRIPRIAPSLGGVESLVEQPALMSYYELDSATRESIGMKDCLVRFSAGVEDTEDVVGDVLHALGG